VGPGGGTGSGGGTGEGGGTGDGGGTGGVGGTGAGRGGAGIGGTGDGGGAGGGGTGGGCCGGLGLMGGGGAGGGGLSGGGCTGGGGSAGGSGFRRGLRGGASGAGSAPRLAGCAPWKRAVTSQACARSPAPAGTGDAAPVSTAAQRAKCGSAIDMHRKRCIGRAHFARTIVRRMAVRRVAPSFVTGGRVLSAAARRPRGCVGRRAWP
jgi:hypothetical protein